MVILFVLGAAFFPFAGDFVVLAVLAFAGAFLFDFLAGEAFPFAGEADLALVVLALGALALGALALGTLALGALVFGLLVETFLDYVYLNIYA